MLLDLGGKRISVRFGECQPGNGQEKGTREQQKYNFFLCHTGERLCSEGPDRAFPISNKHGIAPLPGSPSSGGVLVAIWVNLADSHILLWMRQRLESELRIESVSIPGSQQKPP